MPKCPRCGAETVRYRNPVPTVDVVIEIEAPDQAGGAGGRKIVLIERRNPPPGWALPGGFIDYGESAEAAAVREALEETSLHVELTGLLGVYSDPGRDPRQHTISTAFTATAQGEPGAGDDAARIGLFSREELPAKLAFDHDRILADYFSRRERPDDRGSG